jgi:hypothetical protein
MLAAMAAWAANTSAQTTVVDIHPAYAGDCAVVIDTEGLPPGSMIDLQLSFGFLPRQRVAEPDQVITFPVVAPLQRGDRLRVLVNGDQAAADVTVLQRPESQTPVGTCDTATTEPETSFFGRAYLATIIDTFAPDDIARYNNPEGRHRKTRMSAGVYVDGRVVGRDDDPVQLWIYAETLYGVRSADIDCTGDVTPALCRKDATNVSKAKAILEHATSLEAFVNPRLEFLTLQDQSESPIRLSLTGRVGFLALENAPKVFRTYEVGLGVYLSDGPYIGSYVDVGVGHNDLFSSTRFDRIKIDGVIIFGLQRLLRTEAARFYIQMRVDNDFGSGADAVQTFYGLSFDMRSLFGQ